MGDHPVKAAPFSRNAGVIVYKLVCCFNAFDFNNHLEIMRNHPYLENPVWATICFNFKYRVQ
jgi:hypothetical protein